MTRRQHSELVESLIAAFVERLGEAIERDIDLRTQVLAGEWIQAVLPSPAASDPVTIRPPKAAPRSHAPPPAVPAAERPADTVAKDAANRSSPAALVRRQRSRTTMATSSTTRGEVPASAGPSPEQELRDSEFARLRALLKPIEHGDGSGAAGMLPTSPPPIVASPPTDPIRLLEGEIRSQAHGLAQLPSTCCTARIAAWAGRVRSYEETNGNRVAADLLLDKLRVLARAMDAGRIEALNGSWRTMDWASYIRTNEVLAEARQTRPQNPAGALPDRNGISDDYRDIWS